MDVVAESKKLYSQFLDEADTQMVESMDVPDQAYFWTMLYYEMPRRLGRSMLRDMEGDVRLGRQLLRTAIRTDRARAKSLDGIWETTKPHLWFKAVV